MVNHLSTCCFLYIVVSTASAQAQLPLNPFLPRSSWPEAHSVYCQQNSPMISLTEHDSIIMDSIPFSHDEQGSMPGGAMVSDFFGTTKTYCFAGCNGTVIYKVVCSPEKPILMSKKLVDIGANKIVSIYGAGDKDNVGYFMSDYKLFIAKDSVDIDPYSAITIDTIIDLSPYKDGDNLRGIKMLYSGQLVITSTHGNVLVFDRSLRKVIFATHLHEIIDNNMAVDEGNNVYILSKSSLNKLNWDGTRLNLVWRVPIGGSGTTPTLMGTTMMPAASQLVAVVDRSRPMNLILVWKDSIPGDWKGIEGRPLRVAAVEPITFNTANPKEDVAPTENSLVVSGNSILLARWDGMQPADNSFKPGLEKWTWIPETRSLCRNWVNTTTYIPNSMQCLSTATNYIYAMGETLLKNKKYYTLEAIDWLDGSSKFQKILGPHSKKYLNVFGGSIQIGQRGEIITMSREMIFIFHKFISYY